jgi:hypothetical protein
VQWLKQMHSGQKPTDANKTIVVFDYVFEVSRTQAVERG